MPAFMNPLARKSYGMDGDAVVGFAARSGIKARNTKSVDVLANLKACQCRGRDGNTTPTMLDIKAWEPLKTSSKGREVSKERIHIGEPPEDSLKVLGPALRSASLKNCPLPHTHSIYKLSIQVSQTLNSTEILDSVKLPDGVRRDEWIAAQVLTLFDEVEHLAGVLEEVCSEQTCPVMCAGPNVHYCWADEMNPRPRKLPAKEYIRRLVAYTYQILSNPEIIPRDGSPLPSNFEALMAKLMKRFFRIYAHTYLHHVDTMVKYGTERELRSNFKHYLAFVNEFRLVDRKELMPLDYLIEKIGML